MTGLVVSAADIDLASHELKICYLLSHGFAARMVLHSDLVSELKCHGFKTVILCPSGGSDALRQHQQNGSLDVVSSGFVPSKLTHGQLDELHRYFREPMTDNPALWSRHLYNRNSAKGWIRRRADLYLLLHRMFYGSRPAANASSQVDRMIFRSRSIRRQLRELEPDLVASTYPVSAFEATSLFEAQRLGIPTVGHLLSWDNITCKGHFTARPEYYIAWGPIMTEELHGVYHVPADRIFECGVPHFDQHKQLVDVAYRDTTLCQLGLDPGRPYLLFGMSAPIFAPREIDIVEWLTNQVKRDRFGTEMQLVIRPHPQNVTGNMADKSWLPRLERLVDERVALNKPILAEGGLPWAMETDDTKVLVNLLAGCAVCLNSGSTLSIDAVIHDKPVVVTLFDADRELAWWQSAKRIREFPHYRKLLAMGGVQSVDSFAALDRELNAYLKDPERHHEARVLTVARQCGAVDGHSSERAARAFAQIVERQQAAKANT